MSILVKGDPQTKLLMMGNEAIARGALEAGVKVVAAYPGTPSSEIPEILGKVAGERDLYMEWSVNEKVSLEVVASASLSGLRSLCTMKQVGVNVASDFLLHLAQYGTRAGLVMVTCEDPGALSSTNEGDSRPYSKMMEFPLIEPGDIQESIDMTRWAFELSESIHNIVMLRSVTRMSHASGNVRVGNLPELSSNQQIAFNYDSGFLDQEKGPFVGLSFLITPLRKRQHQSLSKAVELFEECPFNKYAGPEKPELLVITSSAASSYCREAIDLLDLKDTVGMLKLGTVWPLPPRLLEKYLSIAKKVLIVEEGTPFLEDNVKALYAEIVGKVGVIDFFGKKHGLLPDTGELNPDIVMQALTELLGLPKQNELETYQQEIAREQASFAPARALTFCAGCPHRASFYLMQEALAIDGRRGFICGDIGCYSLAVLDCGFSAMKTLASMGSGIGMASGFGKLAQFGFGQPVMAVAGDSTFFHAVLPGLVNAIHNQSDLILVVLDNSGTAMTGFQPHPGTPIGAGNRELPALDIVKICRAMGARVEITNPFEFEASRDMIRELMEDASGGVRVLILRQPCALSPQRKNKKEGIVSVNQEKCVAEDCGCNRMCTRIFKCPGLIWDPVAKATRIDEFVCVGCGVCSQICPNDAITIEKTV